MNIQLKLLLIQETPCNHTQHSEHSTIVESINNENKNQEVIPTTSVEVCIGHSPPIGVTGALQLIKGN